MISWFEKHNKICWVVTIILAVVIFYFSSITSESLGTSKPGIYSILYHIVIFFLFGFFLMVSLVKGERKSLIFLGMILAVVYGISDEVHQFFVPGRNMSLGDVLLDSLGVAFAGLVYGIFLVGRRD